MKRQRSTRLVPLLQALPVLFVLAHPPSRLFAGVASGFRRGDVNLDGSVNLADVSRIIDALYFHGATPSCEDAADANDDGAVNATDGKFLLDWLFPQGPKPPQPPPPPFKDPGKDPTKDSLDCVDATTKPPGNPDPSLEVEIVSPPVLLRGEKVEIFLQTKTTGLIEGFSIAFLVNKQYVEIAGVDLRGTSFPEALRLKFEASGFFRFAVLSDPGSQFDLLLAGAIFVEESGGGLRRISFPQPQGAAVVSSLIRVIANVKATAPEVLGEVFVPLPLGTDLTEVTNEFIGGGSSRRPGAFRGGSLWSRDPGKIFFVRGDSNGDGLVDISDAVHMLLVLVGGGVTSNCDDARDVNDDGQTNITDPIVLLQYLFLAGAMPSTPFTSCGLDVTPSGLVPCLRDC